MSVTKSTYRAVSENMVVMKLECTAETDGSFTSYTVTGCRGMYLIAVKTFPTWNDEGNPERAPADNYDITLTDTDKLEVTGTLLSNRSNSAAEIAFPAQVTRPIESDLTLAVTGITNDSAKFTIKLFFSTHPSAIVAAA